MKKSELDKIKIIEPDHATRKEIKSHWDLIAKPLDGMGQFEDITAQIGAILKNVSPDLSKKAVMVMCSDNGIVEEGVSQSGQEVTKMVSACLGRQETSVCKMAQHIGADVIPVDIGICTSEIIPGVLDRKIRKGTRNFLREPAMTEQETLDAIETGMDLVREYKEKGYTMLATGEMGIGNTTTSTAVAASLLGLKVEKTVGRGAGAGDEELSHKQKVIEEALKIYTIEPDQTLEILETFGGFDIAAMAGIFIGGAVYHVPIVIDGVISTTAALVAERLIKGVRDYMIPSHLSREPAAGLIMKELKLHPVIDASLALGEGTGAVMMFSLIDMAMALYRDHITFSDIMLEQYTRSHS